MDDGFNIEYKHPYLDGIDNPMNRTLDVVCFNSRKLSPVFRGGAGVNDSPIWVDRVGAKATITEVTLIPTHPSNIDTSQISYKSHVLSIEFIYHFIIP